MTVDSVAPRRPATPPSPSVRPARTAAGRSPLTLLRYVVPILVVIGIFAVLDQPRQGPLSNTDTYFHLRFGHEFLDRQLVAAATRAA